MLKIKSREKTKEQLQEELRKAQEEVAIQRWGLKKTLGGMKVLVKELIQKGKETGKAKAEDEAILASIGDGLVALDPSGCVMLMNKVAEELLGWRGQDLIGKLWFEIVPLVDEKDRIIPKDKRPLQKALTHSQTTTTTTSPTYYFIRKDGSKFPAAITTTPVILDGNTIGAIEVFRDITQERSIDQAKSEFVSLASHQLRTPLTTVKWYTEMLLGGDAGKMSEEQIKYLEELYRGNERLITLVNTLLNVSRIEFGSLIIEPKPTDVVQLAREIVKEAEPKIFERKLDIKEQYDKDLPKIKVDPELLKMIIENLLSNAIKFTSEKGHITISLKQESYDLLIKVSDTGLGIPKNAQEKIYTKLFRADNARSKETEGTGLGLYIVKAIVEQSGGKIWFESEEGKGTTFYVTLPLSGMQAKKGTKELT